MLGWIQKNKTISLFLLLMICSAFVYLPRIEHVGYINDDWYLMYAAKAYGPGIFARIFSVDRPARALIMTPAYLLFGNNALYYNLSAYFFRLISGFCLFWSLRIVWPRCYQQTVLASLLFVVFPGFLSQINGIDYQSQMLSLALAMLSVALSLNAALNENFLSRTMFLVLATLFGLAYLSLVEYFLGLEFLRLGFLLILLGRNYQSWRDRIIVGAKEWLPGIGIAVFFLFWRVFFFQSERGATDIGLQLNVFFESPVSTFSWWVVNLLSNSFDVLLLAWGIPFYSLFSILRLRHIVIGMIIICVMLFILYQTLGATTDSSNKARSNWQILLIGLGSLLVGLIPIVLVNRQVDFSGFSRYSLASSAGSCLVLAVFLIDFVESVRIRWALIFLLLSSSVFTHHANTLQVAQQTQTLREFWWQVSWRVPQIAKDTTLIANYPGLGIQEDYFVWGPANLIYYPEKPDGNDEKIFPELYAAVLNDQTRNKILSNKGQEYSLRKNIVTLTNYSNIVVLTRPSQSSCVHLLDGRQPEISALEESDIMLVAPYSNEDSVILNAQPHLPPSDIFGPEPPHDWCYFYEKASLARQKGDWDTVSSLGEAAFDADLTAQDEIEWIPFLQAYAIQGDMNQIAKIKKHMKNVDPFVLRQVCEILGSTPGISDDVRAVVETSYCNE